MIIIMVGTRYIIIDYFDFIIERTESTNSTSHLQGREAVTYTTRLFA